ncbi:hypothetical protein [Variovorax arabinosiphilus]|uniref:hypothetical protein n=1 Tax=Variovorax arabinosiphilus TaxID=3053498 RepID=UPI0025764245|nr:MULTISPECIES: hypothetical protein [unclassified Variovorax]MDM0118864.1 hypothetical protein [Variovorax sp. J2L1-78]MDM0129289.1 hypothetical protein [Variovorax sp. J2L1-63]MDM0232924.1 hypothetical protein [Variovorax sp. J2R1-6]
MTAVWIVLFLIVAGVVWKAVKDAGARHTTVAAASASRTPGFHWPGLGEYDFEVVGESHYQRVLQRLAGEHGDESAAKDCVAELYPDDGNVHDKRAVEVRVSGERVGFMSREDARSFRRRLSAKKLTGQSTSCDAKVVGGWTDSNGVKKQYGLRLDIKTFDT